MDLFPIFYFLLQFWLSCTFSAEPQANINDIIRMGTWRTVTANCQEALGLADGRIKDMQLSALSAYKNDFGTYGPHRARLNLTSFPPGYRGDTTQDIPWIVINLQRKKILTVMAMQGYGDPEVAEWVKMFQVMYSDGASDFTFMLNSKKETETFIANTDSNTIKRIHIPIPVVASRVMIMPMDWNNNVALRMELFGCDPGYYFIIWLAIKSTPFTPQYVSLDSDEAAATKEDTINEVKYSLGTTPGFLDATLVRFSPQETASGLLRLGTEIKIDCIKEAVPSLKRELRRGMGSADGIFDSTFMEIQYSLNENCQPPNVTLELNKTLGNALAITTLESLVLEATVSLKCQTTNNTLYVWEASAVDNANKQFQSFTTLANGVKNTTIEPRALLPGYHYIRFKAEMIGQEGTRGYDFGFIRIIYPELVPKVNGPSSFVKGSGSLTLDGIDSFDPDLSGPSRHDGLSYTWFCRRENEDFSKMPSFPVDVSLGGPRNKGGCFGYGPGRLSAKTKELTLDPAVIKAKLHYVIELVVSKEERRSRAAIHRLFIISALQFSFKCKANCGRRVTTAKRLVLETECKGISCRTVTRYSWTLYIKKTNKWVKVNNLKEMASTDLSGPSIVITGAQPGLRQASSYKMRAQAFLQDGSSESEYYEFLTNEPPYHPDGLVQGCFVNPTKGEAVVTEFKIECDRYIDVHLPLTYDFSYHTSTGEVQFQSGHSQNATVRLPLGNAAANYSVLVKVLVKDSYGAFTTAAKIDVKVTPIETEDMSGALMSMASGEDSQLGKLLKVDKVEEAAQVAYAVLSMASRVEDNAKKNENLTKLKDTIITQLSTVKVKTLKQVSQMAAVVAIATDKDTEMSMETKENAVSMLESTATFVAAQANSSDPSVIEDVGKSLLIGIRNLLTVSAAEAKFDERVGKVVVEDPVVKKIKETKQKSKTMAKKTLDLLDNVGSSLLATKTVGEKPSIMKAKGLVIVLDRQLPDKMGGKSFGQGENSVALPSADTLFGGKPDLPAVDSQMLNLEENPYSWDPSSSKVKSAVTDFSLKSTNGKVLNISGLSKPVELFLTITREEEKENQTTEIYFAKPSTGFNNMRYHSVVIPSEDVMVTMIITPEDNKYVDVFLGVHRKPKPGDGTKYFHKRLPDFSSCLNHSVDSGYYNCSTDPYAVIVTGAVTGGLGLHFVGIRFLVEMPNPSQEDEETLSRKRRNLDPDCLSHSGRQKRGCVGVKTPPPTPPPTTGSSIIVPQYNASTDINYTMSVSVSGCLYWSEEEQKWTSEGCKAGLGSTPEKIQCLCTHLSAFGGDFLVAPNPIDFDKVFAAFGNLGETGNFVVLSLICSIWGLYFILLILARRADKKDELKVIANAYLSENVSEGFVYQITIQTGVWKGYGTTANVAMKMYGEEGSTPPIPLSDPTSDKMFFARGSVNNFTLALPESLGELVKIKIWHDNSGKSPSWFFHVVAITDVASSEKYHFVGNKWLAVGRGDGSIEAEIKVASKKELAGFKNLFYDRTSRSLGDGHLWLSLFTRPPHNPFTRCQRMACCLSILFATMVTNAMFYQFGAAPTDTFQIGPLKLSWKQIKIGIQSSIVAIPVNVLVVTIFKNIKQRNIGGDNSRSENRVKSPGCLPHFFVYVGWIICTLAALAASALTVFYSLMWGRETSNQWLTSIMISIFQDVVVTQPIKVVVIASVLALIIKKPPQQDTVIGVTTIKEKEEKDKLVEPLETEELLKARNYKRQVVHMFRFIVELAFFIFFALLVFVVCYGNRGSNRFAMTEGLEKIFDEFEKVVDTPTFWKWSKTKLIPGLYSVGWYNGQSFDYDEGYISNRYGFLVGMPRIRQLRIEQDPRCKVGRNQPMLASKFYRCIPRYNRANEDRTPYSKPGWERITNISVFTSEFELNDLCPIPWRYQSSETLKTLSYRGFAFTYDGGGFVADLGYNEETAKDVIHKLEANDWLDDHTSAVFVEFTVFDPSSSLFSSAKYVYEKFPTGGSYTGIKVKTMTVYSATDAQFEAFYQICRLLLMIIILFFFFIEIGKIYQQGITRYCKGFWNWMEFIQNTTTIASIVMFFFKEKYASSFIMSVRENPFETSSTDYLVFWSEAEIYLLSVVIFVITVKILRFIRFNHHISKIVKTIKDSAKGLASFFVVFFCVLMAFTQLGYLIFGSVLPPYSSFFNAMRAILQMLLGGNMYFFELQSANRILGPTFVFFYMVSMTMIMLNMFLAIINEAYMDLEYDEDEEVKVNESLEAGLGTFTKVYFTTHARYFWDEFVGYLKQLAHSARYVAIKTKSPSVESIRDIHEKSFDEQTNLVPLASLDTLGSDALLLNDIRRSLADIVAELRQSVASLTPKPLSIFDRQPECPDIYEPYQPYQPYQPYSPSMRYRRKLRTMQLSNRIQNSSEQLGQKTENTVNNNLNKECPEDKLSLVKCSCEETPSTEESKVSSYIPIANGMLLNANNWKNETNL